MTWPAIILLIGATLSAAAGSTGNTLVFMAGAAVCVIVGGLADWMHRDDTIDREDAR